MKFEIPSKWIFQELSYIYQSGVEVEVGDGNTNRKFQHIGSI